VHANAAEVLTAIARTLPSSLANQLGSPIYLQRLFQHTQAPGFGCQVSRHKAASLARKSVAVRTSAGGGHSSVGSFPFSSTETRV
jgi:hypothetical protein